MIDFLKYRYIYAFLSFMIIGGFIGTAFYKRSVQGQVFNYSVDFTGGTQILFKFQKPVNDAQLRDILDKHDWTGAAMRDFGPSEKLIRLKEGVWKKVAIDSEDEFEQKEEGSLKDFGERMLSAINKDLPDNKAQLLSINSVSSGVGAILQWKSFRAVVLALLLMLLYIAIRFWSLSFGMGAVISLAHDAIFILFAFLLMNKEISIEVISAILAILGYSLNDTIVVFNRVKQNIKTMKNVPIYDIVNISINQTLRRTLLTSFATLLVVLSLYFLGGEALRDLSLALLIGMIFGTYSSIYIASTVMLALYKTDRN